VDVNFPTSSQAASIRSADIDDAEDDEEICLDDVELEDDRETPSRDLQFDCDPPQKNDVQRSLCDYSTSLGFRMPLPELLRYGRFCPELGGGARREELSFWKSVNALSEGPCAYYASYDK
jgi:hypothetical protein